MDQIAVCYKCKTEKPITEFYRDKSTPTGYARMCKECSKKDCAERYRKNPGPYKERAHKWRAENYERAVENAREYYLKHREEVIEKTREYALENKGRISAYHKQYWEENGERLRKQSREWRAQNIDECKRYYEERKEYYRELRKSYRSTKHGRTIMRTNKNRRRARMACLPCDLTVEQWNNALVWFNGRCAYCGEQMDVAVQEHFVPVTLGGGTSLDNIIPSCSLCNSKKHAAMPEDFAVPESLALIQTYFAEVSGKHLD